jgi:hypothetical protein
MVAIALFYVRDLWASLRFIKLVHGQATTAISALQSRGHAGYVKVRGRVVRGLTVAAPYSKRPSVYFFYNETHPGDRETGSSFGGVGVAFEIDDGTGRVWVEPKGADVRLKNKATRAFRAQEDPRIVKLKRRITHKTVIKRRRTTGEHKPLEECPPTFVPENMVQVERTELRRNEKDVIYTDTALQPGEEVMVVGFFRPADGERYAGIGKIEDHEFLMISTFDAERIAALEGRESLRRVAVGLLCMGGAVGAFTAAVLLGVPAFLPYGW